MLGGSFLTNRSVFTNADLNSREQADALIDLDLSVLNQINNK